MPYIDAVILNATEWVCRRFQLLTGRTNAWLAVQITNLSIVVYFVWAILYFSRRDLGTRIAVGLFCSGVFYALSYTGTIIGSVKDTSGGMIPRAAVTITNQQTNRQEAVTTDLEGRYTSLPLPPGAYRVEASLQGFRRATRADITVQVNATV